MGAWTARCLRRVEAGNSKPKKLPAKPYLNIHALTTAGGKA